MLETKYSSIGGPVDAPAPKVVRAWADMVLTV